MLAVRASGTLRQAKASMWCCRRGTADLLRSASDVSPKRQDTTAQPPRDKRGITFDLKDPSAIAWLKDHLVNADVLVQNLRPGTMDAPGLDAATLL